MNDRASQAARAAAERLVGTYGVRLVDEVDKLTHGGDREPDRYADPVSIAALIVSTAGLAWTIYKDVRTKTWKPRPDEVAREVRLKLQARGAQVSVKERDQIIEVIAEEIVEDS